MRLLKLFDVLAKESEGLTLADLTAMLESPKSSLLNLLRPMVVEDYLAHSHGVYRLGPLAFRLAAMMMSTWSFSKLARPYLQELAARSRESVFIGLLDRDAKVITYMDAIDSPLSLRYAITIGMNRPLYCTAAGRVLLAYASEKYLDSYLRSTKLVRNTPHTLTNRNELVKELERIRRTGVATDVNQLFEGSAGISAPIFGSDGEVVAAIAIGAPANRFEAELPNLRRIILDVAGRLSIELREFESIDKTTSEAQRASSSPPADSQEMARSLRSPSSD